MVRVGFFGRLLLSLKSLIVVGLGRLPQRALGWIFHLFFLYHKPPLHQDGNLLPGRKNRLTVLAWWGIGLLCKTLDLLALAEWADLITQLLHPRARMLSATEKEEARKIFGAHLNWNQVRLLEGSRLAKIGKWHVGSESMAVCVGHTLHFSRRIVCFPGSRDMRWLVHELAHVVQLERIGLVYIPEALWAQRNGGYDHGGTAKLSAWTLASFNREQQAEICADCYLKMALSGDGDANCSRLMEELKQGLI